MSPDGTWVAFVVAPLSRQDEPAVSAIWVARVDDPASAPGWGGSGRGHDFADRVAGAVEMEEWRDVASGFDHLIAQGIAALDRLGIGGWSQGRFFAQALREHGVPCALVVYPREPHGIRERNHQLALLRRVRSWVKRWLEPGWSE